MTAWFTAEKSAAPKKMGAERRQLTGDGVAAWGHRRGDGGAARVARRE
jgi:hypothetical protein